MASVDNKRKNKRRNRQGEYQELSDVSTDLSSTSVSTVSLTDSNLEDWGPSTSGHSDYSRSRRRNITPARIDISDGVTLTWKNINCYAPVQSGGRWAAVKSMFTDNYRPKEGQPVTAGGGSTIPGLSSRKQLLFGVNGRAVPGELLAIMGASGAGKTTLLNILTCRNLGNLKAEGCIQTNGVEMGPSIKRVSAYVQQSDVFWGCLTVAEHLWFNATLRMGDAYSNSDRRRRVSQLLREMGLDRVANENTAGNQKSGSGGLSGSEKKLLSIASEILVDPPVLFCDEPTTGLDSNMAEAVVVLLRQMAERGKTILCTIHQPASHIFAQFHSLLLLGEGKLAFLGSRTAAANYFYDIGFPCPMNYNPADHYIQTLAVRPGKETECRAKISYIARKFVDTVEYGRIQRYLHTMAQHRNEDPDFLEVVRVTKNAPPYRAGWWLQFRVLVWKLMLDLLRNPRGSIAQIIQNFTAVMTIAILFMNQTYDQVGVFNMNAALFQVVIHLGFLAQTSLGNYLGGLPVYMREHHTGMYRSETYFLAKNVADLPLFFICCTMSSVLMYWSVNLYGSFTHFLLFYGIIMMLYQFSLGLNVYLIGTLSGRLDIALNITPPFHTVGLLMAGFLVNDATVPVFMSWLKYVSMQRYSFELMALNQWRSVDSLGCDSSSCFRNGDDVLKFLNFKLSDVYLNVSVLLGVGFLFRVVALIVLTVKSREKKVQ